MPKITSSCNNYFLLKPSVIPDILHSFALKNHKRFVPVMKGTQPLDQRNFTFFSYLILKILTIRIHCLACQTYLSCRGKISSFQCSTDIFLADELFYP